jgi:hypothetical protein
MPGRHSALTIQMDAMLGKCTIVRDSPQRGNQKDSPLGTVSQAEDRTVGSRNHMRSLTSMVLIRHRCQEDICIAKRDWALSNHIWL